jgi:DNA-binding NtrC family response regulator
LFYRLSTIALELPPLRQRGADIDLLARHFTASLNERFGTATRIGESALGVLRRHSWPGNVRELQHVIEAAIVVCEGEEILPEHIALAGRSAAPAASCNGTEEPGSLPSLAELERSHIRRVLDATRGHRGNAANILGISERNLYRKLREHNLPD